MLPNNFLFIASIISISQIFITSFYLPYIPIRIPANFLKMKNSITTEIPSLKVFKTSSDLGSNLCEEIAYLAWNEISSKGSFFVAVPGGSVLKLLSGLKSHTEVDWNKVHLFYVNHKCVPETDASATHYKAKKLFIDDLKLQNVYSLSNDPDIIVKGHDTDAHLYENRMREVLPTSSNLFPVFDYMLLGMGADGHIGSLYPGRKEVLVTDSWVLSVDKKSPPSITLSLPVINNAKHIRVVLMGADKADAALTGITKSKSMTDFPVCGVTNDITRTLWMLDEGSAAQLESAGISRES